ncbi:hypothetical protein CEXT_433931 [Caerostris extrusa]|uniref:Ycf15 n=1 Tax=Caerostris extrusa TaxID=172846 RepID=A0AAV4WDL0_CAEEX|nr:hypothetical protein CEXT_433931 [Caerostris extrusa]
MGTCITEKMHFWFEARHELMLLLPEPSSNEGSVFPPSIRGQHGIDVAPIQRSVVVPTKALLPTESQKDELRDKKLWRTKCVSTFVRHIPTIIFIS